jgi:hypothetical protein
MVEIILKFDKEIQPERSNKEVRVILKPRCETIVKLRTRSRELETGLTDRTEIAPVVIIARTLTRVRQGACLTSTVNLNDEEEEISLPTVDLEQCDTETFGLHVGTINTQTEIPIEVRLCELRNKLWTDHLNDEERRSVTRICEDYDDIFHLPGDRLPQLLWNT